MKDFRTTSNFPAAWAWSCAQGVSAVRSQRPLLEWSFLWGAQHNLHLSFITRSQLNAWTAPEPDLNPSFKQQLGPVATSSWSPPLVHAHWDVESNQEVAADVCEPLTWDQLQQHQHWLLLCPTDTEDERHWITDRLLSLSQIFVLHTVVLTGCFYFDHSLSAQTAVVPKRWGVLAAAAVNRSWVFITRKIRTPRPDKDSITGLCPLSETSLLFRSFSW